MKEFISRNMPVVVIGSLTVFVFLLIIVLSQTQGPKTSPQLVPLTDSELITDFNPVYGNKDAPVTLVEFSDFECPACKTFYPIVKTILDDNKDSLRLVYKHFPLPIHTNARLAAEASMIAHSQGKFWEYANLLFENQADLSKQDLVGYAEEIGLDKSQFESDLDAGTQSKYVTEDVTLGQKLGVDATPTFYLNGTKMDFRTYEEFDSMIRKAVEESTASIN